MPDDISLHGTYRSRTITLLQNNDGEIFEFLSSSDAVLDPDYTVHEPTIYNNGNSVFGRLFGIFIEAADGSYFHARHVENNKLFIFYSIYHTSLSQALDGSTLNYLLPFIFPWNLRKSVFDLALQCSGISDNLEFSTSELIDTAQCYFTKSVNTATLYWSSSYVLDQSMGLMLNILRTNSKHTWSKDELSRVDTAYKQHLWENIIVSCNGKLILLKPIFQNFRSIGLIVFPTSLIQNKISHYHARPTGGHMGEYKTLFRIRLRFFWPISREDMKEWVKVCAHCVSHTVWRYRKSEMYFSWTVTTPFYIMHINIWSPRHLVDKDSARITIQLMNSMCGLTHFVTSSAVRNINAEVISKTFMENLALLFGMTAVVVVDADSKFRSIFEEMCTALKIHFWPLARGNHKRLIFKRYHFYLNKIQTIAGQYCGTHLSILQNAKTSQYSWNSAPIDNTYLPRSLASFVRDF